jgi:hypothetical protein
LDGVPLPAKATCKQGAEFGGSGMGFVKSGTSFSRRFHPIEQLALPRDLF